MHLCLGVAQYVIFFKSIFLPIFWSRTPYWGLSNLRFLFQDILWTFSMLKIFFSAHSQIYYVKIDDFYVFLCYHKTPPKINFLTFWKKSTIISWQYAGNDRFRFFIWPPKVPQFINQSWHLLNKNHKISIQRLFCFPTKKFNEFT